MNERKIVFKKPEDIQDFVLAAGQCDFDIDVFCGRLSVDAKSFLGVLSVGLAREITVKYFGSDSRFENTVKKYAAC